MKKNKRINPKGITLVALIITVIILLILAGITISIAIDKGNLFTKAYTTREIWNESLIEEETTHRNTINMINDWYERID